MARTGKEPKKGKVPKQSWLNSKILKSKDEKRSQRIADALYDTRNADILKTEDGGYLEAEGMEKTYQITQKQIKEEVDLNTRHKIFDLTLDQFGPYKVQFDRPGRHVLLSGEKGHLAMLDALTQSLICEFHTEERIYATTFLHDWDVFASAQSKYLHLYDSQGIELHCLRAAAQPRFVEFLPFHYLLASCSQQGILRWIDVSTGVSLHDRPTHHGPATCFAQNPHNATVLCGSSRGKVAFWSPNEREPLVSMLCHRGNVLDAAVNLEGTVMFTAGSDCKLAAWDLRTFQCLAEYTLPSPAGSLDISQRGLVAGNVGKRVLIWKDLEKQKVKEPYMKIDVPGLKVENLKFRPFEDQIMMGLDKGVKSCVVPGAGEANIDTYELNPFETRKQRRERNVQKLLDKIPAERIVWDPDAAF